MRYFMKSKGNFLSLSTFDILLLSSWHSKEQHAENFMNLKAHHPDMDVLDKGPEEVARLIIAKSEKWIRLRTVSPFHVA